MTKFVKKILDTLLVYGWWLKLEKVTRDGTQKRHFQSFNRHLALVCWTFPPNLDAGVYRPVSITKYAQEFGWKISVICGPITKNPSPAGNYLLNSLPKDLKVERARNTIIDPSYKLLPKLDGGFFNVFSVFSAARRSLDRNPPSVVMATGPPFQIFVAGYYIAKFFGAKAVFDYRDEWTECPLNIVSAGIFDRVWERLCLEWADKCFFATRSQLEQQLMAFRTLKRDKCRVIPNGWEPNDFFPCEKSHYEKVNRKGHFIISYIGRLSDYALPGEFLTDLERVFDRRKDLLRRITLCFTGEISKTASQQLKNFAYNSVVEIVDHVPKPIATLRMRQSSALLLFNHQNLHRYVPGKVYEYLAAGPPLLVSGAGGEIGSLIELLEAGFVIPIGNSELLEKALDDLILVRDIDWREKRQKREEWLRQHTRGNTVKAMFEGFESLF